MVGLLDRFTVATPSSAELPPALTARLTGYNQRTPLPPAARLWITGPTGCNWRSYGVQRLHPNRPGTGRPAREAPSAAEAADGGGPVGEFFAALGADWRLTGAQRVSLAPAVRPRAERGLDSADAGGLHRGEDRRRAEPVRGAGRAAFTRRTAAAARAATFPAAVVRRMRPGHADARLRRRRTSPVPALQADGRNGRSSSCRKRPF